ncbi:mannose-6-phosphate isomerase [Achaetomium macrosporum]|uniref:Mannose-6-phosphate isomerase n=1 Tax=Achaetomium macrosporum TaxID=79813 RepID=A0AAN7CAZ7_9PEZI|nr:mannose-6-phosphate isomerase [Achaetomium macrosporum]
MADRVFQLTGSCNNYPWGKQGQQSLAAQLCRKTDKDFQIKDDEFYSEMWFGDYPDYPARVLKTGELLKDVLDKNKEKLLGKKVIEHLDGRLPFLPKILSIAKALPLQIHPNKDLAAKLHAKDPENFTDPNHKPEIAIALSKFEVFAGFKPLSEIKPLFRLPALRRFVPADTTQWTDQTLRDITRKLLTADEDTVKHTEDLLLSTSKSDLGNAAYILDLLPRLRQQYGPEDPGSLVALTCMNFMVLDPGDALYIPADGIHAYLSGDIVECMARSNNVLNSGFCPPADRNDINMFTDTLTFKAHSKGDMLLPGKETPKSRTGKTRVYSPPMSEFDMLRAELGPGDEDEIGESGGPGVMIVVRGSGRMEADGQRFELDEGAIWFRHNMRSPLPLHLTLLILPSLSLSSPTPGPSQCALPAPKPPFHTPFTEITTPTCLDSHIPSHPSAWHPWTHKPHCIPASDTPWCVFTDAAHGLSMITTPDEAAGALHPQTHLFFGDDADDGALFSFSAPEKMKLLKQRGRPYEVRDIPGKGKGAVATQRIGRGEVVLVDTVSVLAAVEYPADVLREEVQELLRVAAERLGEPGRVMGLAKQGMEDVMLTNSFGVTLGGKEYMGLFADLARVNHACKPNAFIHFSETTLAMTIWSARDIEPGEEITISYVDAGMTSQERQQLLEQIWGFKCQCDLCTASSDARNASDSRRIEIRHLQDEVVTLAQKGEFNKAVEQTERLFALVDEEGLTEQMSGMYEVPARLYYHVGNLEKALEYTLKFKHEIDGYAVPSKQGEEKLKMLEGVIARIERELREKKEEGDQVQAKNEEKPSNTA